MATNPSLVCGSGTDFTYALSWSLKCEIAEVLSDIPFISAGILVFGVSALYITMKSVSLSAVSLFVSVLLAFIAAVLDLGYILTDGKDQNASFITNGSVIQAREVLLALSIGVRFLFYWLYVAEPSRNDLSRVTTQKLWRKLHILKCTNEPHNGSWMRWGLPGKLMSFGLFVAIVIITTLQILWRVVPQFHQYSNVYATDAALELLISFLLLLKLLLNAVTFNSIESMLIHTFSECLAPISGLLVNIAISVGNLLYFAFTESTVGRLLQVIEVFIVVVFVVVTAFLRHRDILLYTSTQHGKRNDVGFTLPEPVRGSTFRVTPPLTETPRMSTIYGILTQSTESSREMLRRSAHRSLDHVSSWFSFKISGHRSHRQDEEAKLWNANVEKVKAESLHAGDVDTEPSSSTETSTQISKETPEPVSVVDARSVIAQLVENNGRILHSSRAAVSRRTIPQQDRSGSLSSSFLPIARAKHAESLTTPPLVSPIYSLGGIQLLPSDSDSHVSLDELLRQQDQLDQSIKALKPLTTFTSPSHNSPVLNDRSVGLARSPSVGQRTVCSEVSLSNFPAPPWSATPIPSLPQSSLSSIKRIRGDRRVRLAAVRPMPIQDAFVTDPPKPLALLVDMPGSPHFNSIPHTPTGEENEALSTEVVKSSHSGSMGTQYNVTSFIGDLATPGGQGSQDKNNAWWAAENESLGTTETDPNMNKLPPNVDEPSAATQRRSRLSNGDIEDEPNDQASNHLTITLSPPTTVIDRVKKGMSGSQLGRPPLAREAGSRTTGDRAQRVFVRRRPPPLAIQSYAEHNPGASRVHVLVED